MKKNKTLPLIITPLIYAYICGGLYSYAFWDNVDINLLQFLSITDIVSSLILPAAISLPEIIGICILLYIFIPRLRLNTNENAKINTAENDYNADKHIPLRRKISLNFILNVIIVFSFVIYPLIMLIDYMITFGKVMIVTSIVAILSFAIAIILNYKTDIFSYLGWFRDIAFIICIAIPTLSYYIGATDSRNIISGIDYYIIETTPSCSSDTSEKFRYLATASDKIFAISEKNNSICVSRYHTIKLIKKSQLKNLEPVKIDQA